MALRGIRGATTVEKNEAKAILMATKELLKEIVRVNKIKKDDIASVIFTTTPDLNAEFPALAARELGWIYTPLLCTHEIKTPQGLPKCVRVLLHVNTNRPQKAMKNVYLKKAKILRPDLNHPEKNKYYKS